MFRQLVEIVMETEWICIYNEKCLSPVQWTEQNLIPLPVSMTAIQFIPFQSFVDPTFWNSLADLKIDVLRLSQDSVPIYGSYTTGRVIADKESGETVRFGCHFMIDGNAFALKQWVVPDRNLEEQTKHRRSRPHPHTVRMTGTLINFNTIEAFDRVNKLALLNQLSEEVSRQ